MQVNNQDGSAIIYAYKRLRLCWANMLLSYILTYTYNAQNTKHKKVLMYDSLIIDTHDLLIVLWVK